MTTEIGSRKNIYLQPEERTLLATIAERYHNGKESAAIAAALRGYFARGDLIRDAVLALARAIEPDEQFDPADDTRAEEPHLLLAGLLDEVAARAIEDALAVLWTERNLPAPSGLHLNAGALDQLDQLVEQADRPHTRETMLEMLIGEAGRRQ